MAREACRIEAEEDDVNKKLPIGIENFRHVVAECYYVDKTLLVKDILDRPYGTSLLYARPRRFGKSLALSMLQAFFEEGQDNASYFEGTKIAALPDYFELRNQSPVIHLTLKDIRGRDYAEMLAQLKYEMSREYRRHASALEEGGLAPEEKDYARRIISKEADETEYQTSLGQLIALLFKATGKGVVALIDEYDSPVEHAYSAGFYDEAISFFRGFYSCALKGNDALRYGILSGVLQIAKESIFSGLNNLIVNSAVTPAQNFFGFTEEETKALMSYYGRESDYAVLKEHYDGYRFGNETVYNPWSVLNFAQSGQYDDYWVNTGENAVLGSMMVSADAASLNAIAKLLQGGSVISSISPSVPFQDLGKDPSAFLSFLLMSGYLTFKDRYPTGDYVLVIPNEEVRHAFSREIQARFIPEMAKSSFYGLRDSLLKGDADALGKALEDTFLKAFSLYDFSEEKNYQILTLTITALLFPDYYVQSEVNAGTGRADIIAYPKNGQGPGFVIETKLQRSNTTKARLSAMADAALRQIEDKDYAEELRRHGASPAWGYGVVFFKKNAIVKSKRLDH